MIIWFLLFKYILNFLKEKCLEEVMKLILAISIYKGKVGNHDRPSICKIFNNVDKLRRFYATNRTFRDEDLSQISHLDLLH